jgi:hypothetical protein
MRWLEYVARMEKKMNAYKFQTEILKVNLEGDKRAFDIKLK